MHQHNSERTQEKRQHTLFTVGPDVITSAPIAGMTQMRQTVLLEVQIARLHCNLQPHVLGSILKHHKDLAYRTMKAN